MGIHFYSDKRGSYNYYSSYALKFGRPVGPRLQRRRDQDQGQRQREGFTPATGVNAAQDGKPNQKKNNKNQNCSDRTSRDLSQVKCYNCQKMGY